MLQIPQRTMNTISDPVVWPSISEELSPFMKYCKGVVLNAGSGQRDIQLGQRDINIDIIPENQPDIVGDLHAIPLRDASVDTVVSIAVLEHTRYPWVVAQEFYRVLKPGGFGVIAVPFLQPQHACPNDFVRFTENGLIELAKYVGFEVVETAKAHHFGQTLAWLLWKYIEANQPRKVMRPLWFNLIHQLSKGKILKGDSPDTHNTHYIVVRKPGDSGRRADDNRAVIEAKESKLWFLPLLCCPQTRQPLHLENNELISEDGQFKYQFVNKEIPSLLPPSSSEDRDAIADRSTAINPEFRIASEANFTVQFTPQIRSVLSKTAQKVAVLVSTEYEGLSKNGGIGTYYTALSQKLAASGWYVILLLCHTEDVFLGNSKIPALKHVFSTHETAQVLDLQIAHSRFLSDARRDDLLIDYQSLSALYFTQAVCDYFEGAQIYVEFPETWGLAYRTIQAKKANLLPANCVTAVTMHSSHEWIYEVNEAYIVQFPSFFWKLFHYEQFSLENADLSFFPSYFLKSKVESYGWQTNTAKHMPYFVPLIG
jgi:uncharacterized protein YbaR (Trm112 family)